MKESWFSNVSDYCSRSFTIEIFKTYFTCHYYSEAIVKKLIQLNCIVLGFKVLDNGPIFFGIAHCQERGSIACKNRRTEEVKTKVYIFVHKIFINSTFKSYTAIAMGFHALAKWSHYNVKVLQNPIVSVLVILPSDIVPTSQTRLVLTPRTLLPSTYSQKSCYCIITKRTYN